MPDSVWSASSANTPPTDRPIPHPPTNRPTHEPTNRLIHSLVIEVGPFQVHRPGYPLSSTGPISSNAILLPCEASATTWLTSTSPCRALVGDARREVHGRSSRLDEDDRARLASGGWVLDADDDVRPYEFAWFELGGLAWNCLSSPRTGLDTASGHLASEVALATAEMRLWSAPPSGGCRRRRTLSARTSSSWGRGHLEVEASHRFNVRRSSRIDLMPGPLRSIGLKAPGGQAEQPEGECTWNM